ncbi:hypothetical protein GJ496_007163 [Pomphorhynchus laevis]|nr:hypothetical protein GJ496_007163 [Pomphorhynchus laevis]
MVAHSVLLSNSRQLQGKLMNPAYKQFSKRRLIISGYVTDFVTDLKKLSGYIGNGSKDYAKYSFVSGLPSKVQSSIKSLENFRIMDLEALVAIAPVQVQNKNDVLNKMACASTHPGYLRKTCLLSRKSVICYHYGENGHIRPLCPKLGSKTRKRNVDLRISDVHLKQTPLLTLEIVINDRSVRGLLDTGCSQTIVRRDIWTYDTTRCLVNRSVQMMNGEIVYCDGVEAKFEFN